MHPSAKIKARTGRFLIKALTASDTGLVLRRQLIQANEQLLVEQSSIINIPFECHLEWRYCK